MEAGTKGPWRASESWGPPIGTLRLPDEKRDANGNIFWGYSLAGCDERGAPILPTLGAVHNFPDHIHANAALIVAAVNELGALLDEVERLRGALESALDAAHAADDWFATNAQLDTPKEWHGLMRSLARARAPRQALEGGQ